MKFYAIALAILSLIAFAPETFARGSGGHHSSSGSHGSRCVGICYHELSARTGHERNDYVHGYEKRNGEVVQPYTRSH